jgi:hypothetical protein
VSSGKTISRYLQHTERLDARRRLSGNLSEEQTLLRSLIHRTLSMTFQSQDLAFQLSLLTAIQKAIHTLARLDLIQNRLNPSSDKAHKLLERVHQTLLPEKHLGRWVWHPEPALPPPTLARTP